MSAELYEVRTLNLDRSSDLEKLEAFLNREGLSLESDLDYALCLMDGETIVASGCASGNVLKCIAVDGSYQGQSLTNKVITYLRLRAYHKGFSSLFLFTKPGNTGIFEDLGFFSVAESPDAVLMENRPDGVEHYISSLEKPEDNAPSAALVMNCNPFTLGHRYLIEKACRENAVVHLFAVSEDLSVFPFEDRIRMIRQGTEDLKNLYIHEGREYIISRATFPTYFIKEKKILDESHARLDLDLFGKKIGPALNIRKRYVGEEPFCPVTSLYNSLMQEILPPLGMEVEVIPRMTGKGGAVSATKVRKAMADGALEDLKEWVPPSTYDFLVSEEGRNIAEKIRQYADAS